MRKGRPALAGLVVAALAFGGCSSQPTSSDDRPANFQKVLEDARTRYGFPGVQAGVWTPDSSWTGNSGSAASDQQRAITPADHTRIGSLTVTFTVTALLQLSEQGKVSLDDPIDKFVPGMPNGKTATLRNLAAMTSGIPPYSGDNPLTKQYLANPKTVFTAQQLVDSVKQSTPLFKPGEQTAFSLTNVVLLGLVIEKVTGKKLADVLASNVFGPLSLSQTSYPDGSPTMPDPYWSGVTVQGDPAGEIKNATDWNPSFGNAAGEIISTLDDLHTWSVAVGSGEGILKPETQQARVTGTLGVTDVDGWLGDSGLIPGYSTVIGYEPASKSTIVVMINSDVPKGDLPPAAEAVFDELRAVLKPSESASPEVS